MSGHPTKADRETWRRWVDNVSQECHPGHARVIGPIPSAKSMVGSLLDLVDALEKRHG